MKAGGRLVLSEGQPEPLGVAITGGGINVAVYSEHATAIEVCLFDKADREVARIPLPARTGPVFHGHIAGLGAGLRYGLRAHGPFDPARGHRFNPNKLLLDPYAVAIDRPFRLDPALTDPAADSANIMPKAVIPPAPKTPPELRDPLVPWGETVVYELHVRGFTELHPDIPPAIRGTFAGLAHPAAIAHLKGLGVTTVELLPIAAWIDERHLPALGLTDYWGYNPVAMLAVDPRLAPGGWAEVRAATDALAAAGLETVLDVVFNHTGESDELGPTLSLRGLDNAAYHRLRPDDLALYVNDAGTGNVLALDRPPALRLAMEALRTYRHLGGFVGFRFDLAPVLGRRPEGFDPLAPLITAIGQDPELRTAKLIAEPWDLGPGGYQLGRFPHPWGEWNDQFRNTVRSFWRGDPISRGRLAGRLAGSQDLFGDRRPSRSVNYVVSHDGFTLADLVAFETKHNFANGEDNRDGESHSHSWNNGVEGPTDNPVVLKVRLNDQRALLALLLLSRGTPMIGMGAELGCSQGGNNNAYAQDNEIGWLDWSKADPDLAAFAARLIAIRRHPAFLEDRFLTGQPQGEEVWPDVEWRTLDGSSLKAGDWDDPHGEGLVMLLATTGEGAPERAALAVHRGRGSGTLRLPQPRAGFVWTVLADSADPARFGEAPLAATWVSPRSVLALAEVPAKRRRGSEPDTELTGHLAAAAGIAHDWWSLDGVRHAVPLDTQHALLEALGYPAKTGRQARESLEALSDARHRRPLPFALTSREGRALELPLRFDDATPRTWVDLEDEAGEVRRLPATPDVCPERAETAPDGRPAQVMALTLPPLPPGRYILRREDRPEAVCRLTVAPPTAYLPPILSERRRLLALSSQLYSVARAGDQGVGDFTALGELAEAAAGQGCAMLALNPLHALFLDQRDRASPYYPSDRRFLDPIYLDLPETPAISEAGGLIDYEAVWTGKAATLEARFAREAEDAAFAAFIATGGEGLERFAVFQAITESRPGQGWRKWPAALRDSDGPGVRAFAQAHAERVRFHQYVQWLCERQLAEAAGRARGLPLGLCRDLAIGAAPDGAEAWTERRRMAAGVSIGAPPDPFTPYGQVWGLPPLDPLKLATEGYAPAAELYRANMRHAGALRIDHVLGLTRQFWVPEGADGSEGAYIDFPRERLLAELALESHRARCLVIGEDLGTVPDGLREALSADKVFSYRVLPFERDGLRYRPPQVYPALAYACVASHDLAPLAGWWEGSDLAERLSLGLVQEEASVAFAHRAAEKQALVEALAEQGLIEPGFTEPPHLTPALAAAIHAYIARTPSLLAAVQIDDLAGERIGVNVPGTNRERPNWRRRLATPLDQVFAGEISKAILEAMRAERPSEPTA